MLFVVCCYCFRENASLQAATSPPMKSPTGRRIRMRRTKGRKMMRERRRKRR